ncbi:MAG TPA: isoprenyl transferase [Kiloniellaceae bacterium]|nr:isoprenyl transferase [Kiloniellaceae bacterium]
MSLVSATQNAEVPRHVAIIMDGNGRWARQRGLPRTLGHRQGAEAVRRSVRAAIELGIPYLTLFGFSSENWRRPATEIEDLMGLLRRYLQSEIAELHQNGVRLRIVGDRQRLPKDIVTLITDAEALTHDGPRLNLTICLSYGGRQEIVAAARRLAEAAVAGRIDPADIDEARFESELLTLGIPDPDLLVRTSGEQRISNFLLWQSAYSEFVFLEKNWPDFCKDDLAAAVAEFQRRDRRYGASESR